MFSFWKICFYTTLLATFILVGCGKDNKSGSSNSSVTTVNTSLAPAQSYEQLRTVMSQKSVLEGLKVGDAFTHRVATDSGAPSCEMNVVTSLTMNNLTVEYYSDYCGYRLDFKNRYTYSQQSNQRLMVFLQLDPGSVRSVEQVKITYYGKVYDGYKVVSFTTANNYGNEIFVLSPNLPILANPIYYFGNKIHPRGEQYQLDNAY